MTLRCVRWTCRAKTDATRGTLGLRAPDPLQDMMPWTRSPRDGACRGKPSWLRVVRWVTKSLGLLAQEIQCEFVV